jgi:hypothetical protein
MARQVYSSKTDTHGITPCLPPRSHPGRKKNYSEEESLIIREHFNPLHSQSSSQLIQEKYLKHRTVASILARASQMGLRTPGQTREWSKDELLVLEANLGETLKDIHRILQHYWQKNDIPFMGYPIVKRQALLMGKGTKYEKDGYVTKEYLAEGLGCNEYVITYWAKEYSTILHPQGHQNNPNATFFPLTGFRRFARTYPGEISKCKPDLLWLLTVLFED